MIISSPETINTLFELGKIQTNSGGSIKEHFRIRFNPVTKEIEFAKLQPFIFRSAEKKAMTAKSGLAKKAGIIAIKKPAIKSVTNIDAVLGLIQASTEGISTAELKEKTGLAERQIWSIVNRAKKEGKIRKMKRGLYGAVQMQ